MDLGAGIGDYTLIASLKVGNKGKVIAVEPDSESFSLLVKNIRENKLQNVIPLNAAVSNKNEKRNNIFFTTIDSIAKNLKLKKVNIMKMDIEGFEYLALLGAKRTLIRSRPKLVIEIHSPAIKRKISKFLNSLNYKLCFETHKTKINFFISYFS